MGYIGRYRIRAVLTLLTLLLLAGASMVVWGSKTRALASAPPPPPLPPPSVDTNHTSYAGPTPTLTPDCGLAWRVVSSPNPGAFQSLLSGVAALTPYDAWAVGHYAVNPTPARTLILHWDGMHWTQVPSPNVGTDPSLLLGVSAISTNDIWTVGYHYPSSGPPQSLIEHWDGTQWSIVPAASFPDIRDNTLYGVAAVSSNDVWAVGIYGDERGAYRTLIEHWDGTKWSVVPSPNASHRNNVLWDVAAVSANDVWAAGFYTSDGIGTPDESLFLHWDGTQWDIVPSPSVPGERQHHPYGISAISTNDVWAVGNLGSGPYSLHWDGVQWSVVSMPRVTELDSYVYSVEALSASDVWAVGYYFPSDERDETLIYHWDGASWSQVLSPSPGRIESVLRRVASDSSNDLWAVGFQVNFGNLETLVERYSDPCLMPTPSTVPTTTATATITPTPTATATAGATLTVVVTATLTSTPTPTPTALASSTPTPCAITFTDVHPTDFFYEAVFYLYCHGAISGYADGTFRPQNNASRGQLCKIVVLAHGWPIVTPTAVATATATPSFSDVPPGHTFYPYVETAYRRGVISGYSDGTFRPGNDVTRGQLCKIVVLAAGWGLTCPPTPTFADVPREHPFYCYVETAYDRGIISGYADGTFRPGNPATRGQLSKVIYRSIVP